MHRCDLFCFVVEIKPERKCCKPRMLLWTAGRSRCSNQRTLATPPPATVSDRLLLFLKLMLFLFLPNLQQTTGWCLGYILFLTMEGAGLVTLGGCLENYHSSTHDFTHTHKIIKMNQVNFSFSGALSSL